MQKVFVYDPTFSDKKSAVRGIGRYLQILKENFPEWNFTNQLPTTNYQLLTTIFINPFFNFLQLPLTMRRIAKKQIAVIHDLIPLKYPDKFPAGIRGKLNIFLNKLALKNYDLIITDSLASKNDIIKILKIPEKKIKVIYPCLPKIYLSPPTTNHRPPITNHYCLYVGDATWNKNLVNLAKAIKIINVTCVFVGKVFEKINPKSQTLNPKQYQNSKQKNFENLNLENSDLFRVSDLEFRNLNLNHPWQKELKQFIEETKNDKRFVFLGYVKDEDLINLYKNANLNILPSRNEGFGFSYLEAASQGCPTLLSDIPVFHEISNKNSFFNPEDPYDIANKIGEIYFNSKLRNKLGETAKKRSKFFSLEKFKKEFKKILTL